MSDTPRSVRFKEEMITHMDALFNYALYLSGNRDEANDLLQETYLKAFRFFDRFEAGTNAKAWLYRIMKNTFINDYRRTKRIPDHVEYDEQLSPSKMLREDLGAGAELLNEINGDLFDDDIAKAISSLPEKFKSVIILRDVEDLPYEEIADALEIPVGTVRSRLHRARAILFGRLKSYAAKRGYAISSDYGSPEYALAG